MLHFDFDLDDLYFYVILLITISDSVKMPIEYQADFRQSLITGRDYKIDPHVSKLKCHQFSLEHSTNLFPTSVQLLPGKSIQEPWLYGPAIPGRWHKKALILALASVGVKFATFSVGPFPV